MTIERKNRARALLVMGAAVGLTAGLAAPAVAADRTSGHFDVAADVECDTFGNVTDVAVHVHEHVNGQHLELPAGDWLTFSSSTGPELGLTVEAGTTCNDPEVEFVPELLDPSSTGGTVSATGTVGSFSSSKSSASGSAVLFGGDHQDLAWSFSSTGTYVLTFSVTVDGGAPVLSEEVPLKRV